ncbi:MAG: crosslink repair DNA glycosylase YcaQ family protein [Myxococcota bacterium]
MNPTVRAWWAASQGLDGSSAGATAREVLVRTGWMRTVGGAGPYLGLFARAGLSRAAIDAEVAANEICELPAARGCTYLVPRDDYAVALAAGQGHGDAAALHTAKKFCGVTDAEVDRLCDAIVAALRDGPLEPRGLKEAVGGAVRHLGDVGKKKGVTTTLSLGLGRLQTTGEIRRIPVGGRLDQQRYAYAAWTPSPLSGRLLGEEELGAELATRFFRWIGPATVDQFAWWSGATKTAARAAVAAIGAVPLPDDPDQRVLPGDLDRLGAFQRPEVPRVAFVSSLDNLAHLRREVTPLVDPQHVDERVAGGGFGPGAGVGGVRPVSTVLDLPHHAIVDRGTLIGLWDYDPAQARIVHRVFAGSPPVDDALACTTAFVRDQLGDARSFGLDSPESRGPRLAALSARAESR